MRRLTALALSAALCVPVALAVTSAELRADAARDARLLILEGKFQEAGATIEAAPDEIKNDGKVRLQLAEQAVGELRRAEGEKLSAGLWFARSQYIASFEVEATTEALAGVLSTTARMAAAAVEAKKPEDALAALGLAVSMVEEGLGEVQTTPELEAAIARVYGTRGEVADATKSIDQILDDLAKGSDRLATAASGHVDANEWLAEAADFRMKAATLVFERLPEGDERGPANVRKAVEYAAAAAQAEGAKKEQHTVHLQALRLAQKLGVTEDLGRPEMEKLGKPEVEGLELMVPKAEGWSFDSNADWNLLVTRRIPGDHEGQVVQMMVTRLPKNQPELGQTWADPEKVAEARWEAKREGDFDDLVRELPAMQLGDKKVRKKDPEVFHFELGGTHGGRQKLLAEWLWTPSKKSEHSYHVRILDWGTPWSVEDPDIVAFLESAFGPDRYPVPQDEREKIYKKNKKGR